VTAVDNRVLNLFVGFTGQQLQAVERRASATTSIFAVTGRTGRVVNTLAQSQHFFWII
jgi:hypothetical protein